MFLWRSQVKCYKAQRATEDEDQLDLERDLKYINIEQENLYVNREMIQLV